MLIGRAHECERIGRLLEDAKLGRSGVLIVYGPPGVGKTALLDYALQQAARMETLRVAGVESEVDLPYAGLHALLRPVLELIGRLPDAQSRALKVALALEESPEVDRLAASAGTLTLLAEAAERAPLLVVVDDLHWLDRASAEALVFSARRFAGEQIVMLFAGRDAEPALELSAGLPQLGLEGLAPADAVTLLRERWGAGLDSAVAERIAEATEGNPLALLDIPSLLSERERQGLEPLQDPLPVSMEIERSVQRSLGGIPEAARRALLRAALGDGRQGVDAGSLGPAVEAGLVRINDGGVVFRHPLVRSALWRAAPREELRSAHLDLAGELTDDRDQDRRAWHLAAAADGPDEGVAAALEAAAERARARGGYASQARALERAAELSADDEGRARRLLDAAVASYWGGEPVRAIDLAERARGLARDPLLRADTIHRLAVIADWHGKWEDKIVPAETLEREAAVVEAADPRRAAALLGVVLQRRFQALETRAALEFAERRLALCEPLGGERYGRALQDVARAHGLRGNAADAGAVIDRVLTDYGSGAALAFATNVAEPLVWLERYGTARRLLEASIDEARRDGNIVRLMFELTNLALLEFRVGRFSRAFTGAFEAAELAEHTGNDYFTACNLATLARVDAVRGDEATCRERAARAATLARRLGDELVGSEARMALAHLVLAQGKPAEAAELLEPVARLAAANEVGEPGVLPYSPDLIEALVRSGEMDRACQEIERLEGLATRTSRSWALAAAARYRGFQGGEEEMDACFQRALELHAQGSPFEIARTKLCYGERLRRARRRVDAREHLRHAVEAFDALRAEPWAERARAELRATGASVPRRDPTAPEKLTPQELQISLQVAEGKTNREVGAALFLSPKTVEYHLTHVYRKLDIHSRAELVRLFSGAAAHEAVPA